MERGRRWHGILPDDRSGDRRWPVVPFRNKNKSARHPKGYQAVVRIGKEQQAYALIHTFAGALPQRIEIPLPEDKTYQIEEIFSDTKEKAVPLPMELLLYEPKENFKAVAVRLSYKI